MNGQQSEKEARFLEKARQSLLASEERLDAATLARLRDARAKAVEAAEGRARGFFRIPNWMRPPPQCWSLRSGWTRRGRSCP